MNFPVYSFLVCVTTVFLYNYGVQLCDCLLDQLYYGISYLDNVQEFNHKNPNYLEGNWKPIHNEIRGEIVEGHGALPEDLVGGTYARIGANLNCWPPSNKHHAFNGEAMIHLIHLNSNRSIKFSNSWVRENLVHQNWDDVGGECPPKFGFADLNEGGLAALRYFVLWMKTKLKGEKHPPHEQYQAGSTAIVSHAGLVFACSEIFQPFQIELTSESVRPVGFYDFHGKLSNRDKSIGPPLGVFTAHPAIDPGTGEMYFIATNPIPGDRPHLDLGVVDRHGSLVKYIHIPARFPMSAFYHDILLTENYIVFPETSIKKDHSRLRKFENPTFYNSSQNIRFGVIPRNAEDENQLVWIESESPGHIWHTISAREEQDGNIVLFAPKFKSYSSRVDIHLSSEEPSYLTKFVLDLQKGTATEKILSDYVVERPSVNLDRIAHKYAYLRSEGLESRENGKELLKFDLEQEKVVGRIQCEEMCIFNEAIFTPRKSGQSEDDGYLMDIVYYPSSHSSSFMVWDAKTFSPTPLFESRLPQRVPYGVHGIWFEHINKL